MSKAAHASSEAAQEAGDRPTAAEEQEAYEEFEWAECWHCCGEGWGFIGTDWDDDPLWNPPGSYVRCPCCGGSGEAQDCTFW